MRRVGGGETARHVLVDGNNVLHKAHYVFVESRLSRGLPLLSTPDGFPTGVIHGFLDMLGSWLRDMAPFTSLNVFFDGRPTRRKAADSGYKAGRDESSVRNARMSDASGPPRQLPGGAVVRNELEALAHVLPLLGASVYHHPDEESDDLIASFCASRPEAVKVIVSSDKDFFQLLSDPRTVCYVPGSDGDRFYDAERSAQYWERLKSVRLRIEPRQVRMFKALCGDSSDAIRGVPKLRKKAALPLCHLGSIDEVLRSGLPGFSTAERETTASMADRLRLNLELVSLRTDIDLSGCLTSAPAPDPVAARHILAEGLHMASFDPSPFSGEPQTPYVAVARKEPEAAMPPIPLDPWLSDI